MMEKKLGASLLMWCYHVSVVYLKQFILSPCEAHYRVLGICYAVPK